MGIMHLLENEQITLWGIGLFVPQSAGIVSFRKRDPLKG